MAPLIAIERLRGRFLEGPADPLREVSLYSPCTASLHVVGQSSFNCIFMR